MVKPKIGIYKKKIFEDGYHYRHYYLGMFALDPNNDMHRTTGKKYQVITLNGRLIETERQLA